MRHLEISIVARSGLRKVIGDTISNVLFEAFTLIDGVSNPEVERVEDWYPWTLVQIPDEDPPYGMLHDEWYALWHDYLDWRESVKKEEKQD